MSMMFCRGCGKEIHESAVTCPQCGAPQSKTALGFGKKQSTAFLLAFFLGGLGGHRFYLGNIGLGILYLLTLGLFGMGALVDLFNLTFMRAEVFAAKYNNGAVGKPIGAWAKVMVLVFPALIVMAIVMAIGSSSYRAYKERHPSANTTPSQADKFAELAAATPAKLSPSGELASMFNVMSENTDLQRENKFKEIKGKVVEWTLPVYEVAKHGDGYEIQTEPGDAVGTSIHITPRNDEDKAVIEALKTGGRISFKGIISDVSMRNLEINPAILFQSGSAMPAEIQAQDTPPENTATPATTVEPSVAQQSIKPSFDCAKASTDAERLICSSQGLATLDAEMMEAYKRLADGYPDMNALKKEQSDWRRNKRDTCATSECMANAYRSRTEDLEVKAQYLSKPAEFR